MYQGSLLISLNGRNITIVQEHKYLGVVLHESQSDDSNMKRHVKQSIPGVTCSLIGSKSAHQMYKTTCLKHFALTHMEDSYGPVTINLCIKG